MNRLAYLRCYSGFDDCQAAGVLLPITPVWAETLSAFVQRAVVVLQEVGGTMMEIRLEEHPDFIPLFLDYDFVDPQDDAPDWELEEALEYPFEDDALGILELRADWTELWGAEGTLDFNEDLYGPRLRVWADGDFDFYALWNGDGDYDTYTCYLTQARLKELAALCAPTLE